MRQRKSKAANSAQEPCASPNHGLEKRLISYALAATAAGVGALACAPHAEARVVFTNTWVPMGPGDSMSDIDLNSDGVVDFRIANYRKACQSNTSSCIQMILHVLPRGSGNAVWGKHASASALGSGVSVGPNGKFQAGHEFMGSEAQLSRHSSGTYYRSAGPWRQVTNRYLGVKFMIQGQVHFGWVRIDVAEARNGIYSAISGYAYETVPNRPILTGQKNRLANKDKAKKGSAFVDVGAPASDGLGALAIGALGLQMPGRTR